MRGNYEEIIGILSLIFHYDYLVVPNWVSYGADFLNDSPWM